MKITIQSPTSPRFPAAANTVEIRNIGPLNAAGRPRYFWQLGITTLVAAAIPAAPAVGNPGEEGYVPAVEPQPARTDYEALTDGNVDMTVEQWRAWPGGGTDETDEAYQATCVLATLGLVAAA